MAPAGTPGRKKRENNANYFDPGVVGRRTGVTLKDRGVRDEHGMEPLDGIFSSPEKSPAKGNARKGGDVTLTSSEEMEVGHSSIPEPVEVLTERRQMRNNRTLLPPKSRSPIKTFLGSSPRRHSSLAPQANGRQLTSSPAGGSSDPAVARRLDFSANKPRQSIEGHSPSVNGHSALARDKLRQGVYDLQISPEQDEQQLRGGGRVKRGVEAQADDGMDPIFEGDEDYQAAYGDDSGDVYEHVQDGASDSEALEQNEPEPAPAPAPARGKRGRPRKSDVDVSVQSTKQAQPTKGGKRAGNVVGSTAGKGRAAPKTNGVHANAEDRSGSQKKNGKGKARAYDGDAQESAMEPSLSGGAAPKRRGRPKASDIDDRRDEADTGGDDSGAERPGKRMRDETAQDGRAKKKAKKAMPPPSQRGPKARVGAAKKPEQWEDDASVVSGTRREGGRARDLQILRQGTPMEESGARMTRYGRPVVAPLAFYKGEHFRWAPRSDRDDLPGIQEVVRVDEIHQPGKKQPRKRRRQKRDASVEEEEEQLEEWEEDEGVLMGYVNAWDPDIGTTAEDEVELAVAFASSALETREVSGANFRFAKCMTLPFFGCGMVELPPMGFKKLKNANRMQMVFFVHYGKVVVEVAGNEFTISKGGVWQVPRGNFYSITNNVDKPAKIFFAQGCEAIPELEEVED